MASSVDALSVSSSSKIKQKSVKCTKCNKNVRKLIECICCNEIKHLNCSLMCKEGEKMSWKCCDCTTGVSMTNGVGTPSAEDVASPESINSDINTIKENEVCELKSVVYIMMEDIRILKEDNKLLRREIEKLSQKPTLNTTNYASAVKNKQSKNSPMHSQCNVIDLNNDTTPAAVQMNKQTNTMCPKYAAAEEKHKENFPVLPQRDERHSKKNRNSVGQLVQQFEKKAGDDHNNSVVVLDDEVHLLSNCEDLPSRNTSGIFQIETIINKKSTKVVNELKDVIVMGDSLVRLASQVALDLKDCTYVFPGMRLENVAQALERILVNIVKPKTLFLHFGTNNVKSSKNLDVITGEAYDMLTKVKKLLPSAEIILNGIVYRRDVIDETIQTINANLEWVCNVHNVAFSNPNDRMGNIQLGLSRDGLHLNMRGARKLGQIIIDDLLQLRSKNWN